VRLRFWQLGLLVIAVCGAGLAVLEYRRASLDDTPGALLARLPQQAPIRIAIDVGALRDAGLLHLIAGSKATEEADYTSFVEQTAFDYRSDLDLICASFHTNANYFAVKGRFHWPSLQRYATNQGGQCNNGFCTMPSAQPNRRVSFYLLKQNVLALASSSSGSNAYAINPDRSRILPREQPFAPVWWSVDAEETLKNPSLPAGLQYFLSPVRNGKRLYFGLQPGGNALQLTMQASLPSTVDAATASTELASRTAYLHKQLQLAKQVPDPSDLSGVLAAGKFQSKEHQVMGEWPIEAEFLNQFLGASAK